MRSKDKILGVLYGQAIGDAIGMPSELWPVENIRDQFGGKITTFLDGPDNNDIAKNFKKGQFRDLGEAYYGMGRISRCLGEQHPWTK